MYCIYLAQSFTTSLNVDLRQDINRGLRNLPAFLMEHFLELRKYLSPWEENVHALLTVQFFVF